MVPLLINQVMIGTNLNTAFPVYLQITSNDNSTTLILIVAIVVVLCAAVIMIATILLIVKIYTQHRNRKYHLNENVTELEQRHLANKIPNSSKSIQLLFWYY